MDPSSVPTARDVGFPPDAAGDVAAQDAFIPWIDVHQHTQSLTWNDRNTFDLSGGRAVVMIAASYYWSPYRPVASDDVRFLWDDALRRAATFDRSHAYDQYVATGIHTWSRVTEWEELLEVLPEYCALESVVAIGETGIESTQHTTAWPLEDQRDVVRGQMHVARETDVPILLHTPGSNKGGMPVQYRARYEESNESFTDPVLAPESAKADAIEICLELADEAGLDHDQMVIDHAAPRVAPRVLNSTDCYLAFSVSAPWLRGIDAEDIAGVIDEFGSDRILIDTDLAGAMRNDPFAMKRMILDLLRIGVEPADVRAVVYENQCEVLGIA